TRRSSDLLRICVEAGGFGRAGIGQDICLVCYGETGIVFTRAAFLPDELVGEIRLAKKLIGKHAKMSNFVFTNGDKNMASRSEQLPSEYQPRRHHRQPLCMPLAVIRRTVFTAVTVIIAV